MADNQLDGEPLYQFMPNFRTVFNDAFKKEIYCMFHRYILRPKFSKMWGFPYVDEDGKVRYCSNQFTKRQSSDIEKCRCGKDISLQGDNWFLDENGCEFHPGKLVYSEKLMTEVLTCCRKSNSSKGCTRRKHHVSTARVCNADEFVKTFRKQVSYLPRLPNVFALDCEMVYTTKGMEVVQVTVLTVFCDVVYDTFVKPRHPVIDYNTEFSGIDESKLENVTIELKQVQSDLIKLFDTNTILVGHGLENDLLCLNLYHAKVIDTAILFPHSKGFPWRHSLKTLAKTYLDKEIHCSPNGHDSKEDARTCIELIARKIFFSKRKQMKTSHILQSQMAEQHSAPYEIYEPPDFRLPVSGNWNAPYWRYIPPPYPYSSYPPARHPLLSFPLYQKKYIANLYAQQMKINNYTEIN